MFRILPQLTDRNRGFWTSGADGVLRFLRCESCGYYVHPPVPLCPQDQSRQLSWQPVCGRAVVETFTVNHKQWMPGPEVPYVVAIVAIEEQPSVRLTTNIVDCEPEDVHIGMAVEVTFEHQRDGDDEIWLPLFRPRAGRRPLDPIFSASPR